MGHTISEELYAEAIAQTLTVLNELEKPRLTRWDAISYEYALERALSHPELSDEQRDIDYSPD